MLAESPERLVLTFNEPVTPLVVQVIDPTGVRLAPDTIDVNNGAMTVRFSQTLAKGTSLLSYRVISPDGHPVAGSVSFSVGHPSVGVAASDPTPPVLKVLIWLARVGFYIGLLAGIGGAFFRNWIESDLPATKPARQQMSWLIKAGLLSAVVGWGLQGLDATGAGFESIVSPPVWGVALSTSYALTLATGALAMLVALVAGSSFRRPTGKLLSAAALAGAGAALSLSGHASSAEPRALMGLAVGLHGICVAFWAGALLPLLDASRRFDFWALLRRFSHFAVPAVVLLGLTGVGIASVQLASPAALLTTAYGQILALKLIAVALLLCLALVNRFWLTPALADGAEHIPRKLRTSIQAELALMVVILCLAGLWRFTPPPRALLIADAQPAHLHIHTEQAMVDVTLTPGHAGLVNVGLYFQNGEFGPLTPKEVTVQFSLPSAGIEAIERKATPGPDGLWSAGPFNLQPAGAWDLRVDALITDFSKAILEDRIEIRP